VVTGAAREHGIGRAICLRYAQEGARVAILDLDVAGAERKSIVIALLDADGFTLVDLGVNVPPEQIAETVEREHPDVLGLSCLLTSGYEALRETIGLVRGQSAAWHPHLPIVLGGAAVDAMVKERLGADAWCDDAARGLGVVRALLA
jgi:methanogenic corrinoid protein MtbC1